MNIREAAEMALEALEQTPTANKLFDESSYEAQKEAIQALRQALAQPPCQAGSQCIGGKCPECEREWVGLTDDEVGYELTKEFGQWWSRHVSVCRAIEAKLKEKNT